MALEQYNFGSGNLVAVRTDISPAQPRILGTLQDVSVDFSFSTKELTGQYQAAVAIGRGALKISGKAKFAKIQAGAFNDIFFGQTVSTGTSQQVVNEGGSGIALTTTTANTSAITNIGSAVLTFAAPPGALVGQVVSGTNVPAGSYVVSVTGNTVTLSQTVTTAVASGTVITFGPSYTVANPANFQQDLGVMNAVTGSQLTYVASGPTSGQYSVNTNTGTYVFSTADSVANVTVVVSYRYNQSTTGNRIILSNQLMGSSPYVQLNLFNQFTTSDNVLKTNGLILYRAMGSKLSFDYKNEDFTIPEWDFSAMANAAGQFGDWSSTL